MNGTNPKSTASIAGHPIHPMLIPFPVVFLVTALVSDFVFWATDYEIWATASMWFLGAGIVMALVAALFGFTDFFGDSRIRDISDAWQHLIGNLVAVVLAFINWFIRYKFRCRGRRLSLGILDFPHHRPAVVVQRLERLGNGLSVSCRSSGYRAKIMSSATRPHTSQVRQLALALLDRPAAQVRAIELEQGVRDQHGVAFRLGPWRSCFHRRRRVGGELETTIDGRSEWRRRSQNLRPSP